MMGNRESLLFFLQDSEGWRMYEFEMSDYGWKSLVTYPNFQTALRQALAGGKSGRQGPFLQSKDTTRKRFIKTGTVVSSSEDWWVSNNTVIINTTKSFLCAFILISIYLYFYIRIKLPHTLKIKNTRDAPKCSKNAIVRLKIAIKKANKRKDQINYTEKWSDSIKQRHTVIQQTCQQCESI